METNTSKTRPATIYVVEYRASVGISVTWECPGTRRDSSFGTEAEAEAAIEALRGLGDEWTDADYRVTAVRS